MFADLSTLKDRFRAREAPNAYFRPHAGADSFVLLAVLFIGLAGCSGGISLLPTSPLLKSSAISTADLPDGLWSELYETLDRAVIHQHQYHALFGVFAPDWKMLGLSVPDGVSKNFDLSLMALDGERFVMSARYRSSGRNNGREIAAEVDPSPLVSIDQSFVMQSKRAVPQPRRVYLIARARQVVRALAERAHTQGAGPAVYFEKGVFEGYFDYARGKAGQWTATGRRGPVENVVVRAGDGGVENLPSYTPVLNFAEGAPGQRAGLVDSKDPVALLRLGIAGEKPMLELARALHFLTASDMAQVATKNTDGKRQIASSHDPSQAPVGAIRRADGLVIEPLPPTE